MDKLDLNNLTGKCLISAPYADEDDFTGTLIYICLHNHDGAMGFIINKKIKEFSFQDIAFELPISGPLHRFPLPRLLSRRGF